MSTTNEPLRMTQSAARALMLATLGLDRRPRRRATRDDVLATIRRLGVLQIDTIHVVARSPYLVLWSRLGAYDPRWLDELLAEGALFEYWAHEACFVPIEDYPLMRHRMIDPATIGREQVVQRIAAHREQMDRMLEHIADNGPVRSADFVRTDGKSNGWWDWKIEKRLLELLFITGEVMVARRHNFQRVYDLRERVLTRVLPTWDDDALMSHDQARRNMALNAVRALGVANDRWATDYYRTKNRESGPLLQELAESGELLRVEIDGWSDPFYLHPENEALARDAVAGRIRPGLTTLISPFDPLVWDRARARALFGFDYRIECYTPAPKRRYGYFTLPILRRGALVGRLDPKAHRKDGVFEVKSIHLEPGVAMTDALVADLARALRDCAAWHGTPTIVVRKSDPPKLARQLERACAA